MTIDPIRMMLLASLLTTAGCVGFVYERDAGLVEGSGDITDDDVLGDDGVDDGGLDDDF